MYTYYVIISLSWKIRSYFGHQLSLNVFVLFVGVKVLIVYFFTDFIIIIIPRQMLFNLRTNVHKWEKRMEVPLPREGSFN